MPNLPHNSKRIMSIAFKEWAVVCEALGRGAQSIIIRKGGIAEGRDGFRFKHDAFFLFPTLFHEQLAKTTLPEGTPMPQLEEGTIKINLYARVEWTSLVTDWEVVRQLEPFHLWQEEAIAERFKYDEPSGVHVALLRIFKLQTPWSFPDSPGFGGCRSWLDLPEPPQGEPWFPVLDDATHAARVAALRAILP